MRQRCEPSRDTLAWKQYRFRPPDPVWAPSAALTRTRAALRAYDPYLDLWWSPLWRSGGDQPGRWVLKEWLPSTGSWVSVFAWEGAGGTFRNEFPIDQILNRLYLAKNVTKESPEGQTAKQLAATIEAKNESLKTDRAACARDYDAGRLAGDQALYQSGARIAVRQPGTKGIKKASRERQPVPR